MPKEPDITINGRKLTPGQAMTVRVALNSFLADLQNPEALGDDDHGREMTRLYVQAINEMNAIMRK